jgi:predicted phosphohydrolase
MNTFRFQLYSDIHLELSKTFPKIPKLEDNLILAGDIGKLNTVNYKPFFDYCSALWKKVFYILGNHEFYHSNKTFLTLKDEYKKFFSQYDNVILLDNSSYEYSDNLRIVGSILWSNPISTIEFNDFIHIKDFKQELDRKMGISLESFKDLHQECINYLLGEISKNDKNLLIITHFPPWKVGTSHPKFKFQPEYITNYFASDMLNYIPINNKIKCWIFGHTHYSNDIISHKNIRLLSNQMGYPKEEDINMKSNGQYQVKLVC